MNPYLYMIVGLWLIPYSFFLSGSEQPNIIYILADDMGYGDVAANNPNCKFPTPFFGSAGGRRHAFFGCSHQFLSLHANPLRHTHGSLLLAHSS